MIAHEYSPSAHCAKLIIKKLAAFANMLTHTRSPLGTGKHSHSAVNVHYVYDRHPLLVLQTACRPRAPEILLWSINPVYYSPDRIHADFSHRFYAGSRQALDSRESIKPRIKAQDSLDSMVFHDGQMHGITRRHLSMSHDNFLCALCCGKINGQHLVGNTEQSVERRLDGVPPTDSDVAV